MAIADVATTPTGEMSDEDFHRSAIRLFHEWCDADQHNRDEALDDLNFQALNQWDELDRQDRAAQYRPCFTVDMCSQYVRQIDGELRQNPLAAKIFPAEGGDFEVAEVIGGMWRAIEEDSFASRVFSLAGGQAAACGMGHFRLSWEYEHDDTFLQKLALRSIPNTHAVVRDPMAILPDNTDLNGCFVYDDMPHRAFRERWPKATLNGWPSTDASYGNRVGWFNQDTIRVCEYWYVKHVPAQLVQFSDGAVMRDATPERLLEYMMRGQMEGRPVQVVNRRQVKRRQVCMRLMSGAEILPNTEGSTAPYEFPGSIIPIFTVEGEVVYLNGKRHRRGMIRPLKDTQRIRNWAKTAEVETTAMAPRQKWIATQKMVKGREEQWRHANSSNASTLIYEVDDKAPESKPQRIDPPDYNPAAANLADRSIEDGKSITGLFGANLGEGAAGDSGVKVKSLQDQGNTGSYLYIDNLTIQATAAAKCGVEVLPHVYDTTRMVRMLGEDMRPSVVRINAGGLDLNRGKYDMRYRAGPSFATARQESAQGMKEALQYIGPQYADIIVRRLAKAQDWPEADDIAREMDQRAAQLGQIGGAPAMPGQGGGGTPAQIAPGAPAPRLGAPPASRGQQMQQPPQQGAGDVLPARMNAAGVYEVETGAPPAPAPAGGRPPLRIVALS